MVDCLKQKTTNEKQLTTNDQQPTINNEGHALGDYKDLTAWRKSMDLVEEVYPLHTGFSQRRAVWVSGSDSMGSGFNTFESGGGRLSCGRQRIFAISPELETQLLLAERIGYLPNSQNVTSNLTGVKQLINGLIRSMKDK